MDRKMMIGSAFMLLALTACGDDKKDARAPDSREVSATKSDSEKSAEVLKSLTKEQQEAVKILIRDTLVSNPKILLDAQMAFEAQAQREQNDLASKAFVKMKDEANVLSFGPKDAKVTVIEFFDYKCGFCHAANPFMQKTMEKHKDVRFIFKELPILSQNSIVAAKAAIASNSQGKYLAFHRALLSAKGDLGFDQIMSVAASVGLDTKKLEADMKSESVQKLLDETKKQAEELQISGTPTFLINGKLIGGFSPTDVESTIGAEKSGAKATD